MIAIKSVTGELDGKPCIWLENKEGEVQKLAEFDDEECYEDFLKCVEAGWFAPKGWFKKMTDLKNLKRYEVFCEKNGCIANNIEREKSLWVDSKYGEYVKLSDVEELVNELAMLKDEIKHLHCGSVPKRWISAGYYD